MTPKVATSDSGTAMPGMMVAAMLRRKRNITITTNATVSINSNRTSLTEARMVVVLSVKISTWMDAGRDDVSWGNSCLIRSTTEMMFAPGWR